MKKHTYAHLSLAFVLSACCTEDQVYKVGTLREVRIEPEAVPSGTDFYATLTIYADELRHVKCVGYFDENEGYIFELSPTTVYTHGRCYYPGVKVDDPRQEMTCKGNLTGNGVYPVWFRLDGVQVGESMVNVYE